MPRVTGSPIINGMTGLELGVYIWKSKDKNIEVAFGLSMKNVSFDQALDTFTGVQVPATWLSDVSIGIFL